MAELRNRVFFKSNADKTAKGIRSIGRSFNNLNKNLRGTKREARNTRKRIDRMNKSLRSTENLAKKVAIGLGLAFSARAVVNILKTGSAIAQSRAQLDLLLARFNDTSEEAIPRLRKAADGLLTDLELIGGATQAIQLGLSPSDVELIIRASRTIAARRPDLDQAQAFDRAVMASTRRTLQLVDELGIGPDEFKKAKGEAEKLALVMRQLRELAEASPADTSITRFERHLVRFRSIAQRAAAAIVNSPAANELLDKLDRVFNADKVKEWGEAIENALSKLTLRDVFQTFETEASNFLRSPTGRVIVGVMSGFLGLRIGGGSTSFLGNLFGKKTNVMKARGSLLGFGIGALTGSLGADYADPVSYRLRQLSGRHGADGFSSFSSGVTAESLAKDFITPLLEAMAHAAKQEAPALVGILRDAVGLSRSADANVTRTGRNRYEVPAVSVSGSRPTPKLPRYFQGDEAEFAAYVQRFAGAATLAGRTPTPRQASDPTLRGLAGAAAGSLANSFARLELSVKSAAGTLGSVFGSFGAGQIQLAASGGAKGKALETLGIGLASLGIGTILGAIFGDEQQEQTTHLEAISRNTENMHTVLAQALGTPGGHVATSIGALSYDGLGAQTAAELVR